MTGAQAWLPERGACPFRAEERALTRLGAVGCSGADLQSSGTTLGLHGCCGCVALDDEIMLSATKAGAQNAAASRRAFLLRVPSLRPPPTPNSLTVACITYNYFFQRAVLVFRLGRFFFCSEITAGLSRAS